MWSVCLWCPAPPQTNRVNAGTGHTLKGQAWPSSVGFAETLWKLSFYEQDIIIKLKSADVFFQAEVCSTLSYETSTYLTHNHFSRWVPSHLHNHPSHRDASSQVSGSSNPHAARESPQIANHPVDIARPPDSMLRVLLSTRAREALTDNHLAPFPEKSEFPTPTPEMNLKWLLSPPTPSPQLIGKSQFRGTNVSEGKKAYKFWRSK